MNFQFIGIDHIQLAAPNGCETEAREFWGNKMGLHEIPKPESLQGRGGCWFKIGNQQLHIGVEEDFQPAKKAHPAFIIRHLETFKAHLEEQGVKTKDDAPIDGRSRFFVSDPFGNRVEFLEYK
ncbi:VOC family protein [Bacillus sp. CGMCC 1.16607]|uniref:VOC family protein n=1 Tax=Bacillus sp. CGMCC 1.16607 TaxID=3351842 RepID=UPI00363C99A7